MRPFHAATLTSVSIVKPALEMPEEDWDSVVDTNLRGAWLMAQGTAKRWVAEKQQEGRGVGVFWAVGPMMLLFLLAFAFIVNEEIFKGMKLVTLNTKSGG